MVVISSSWVIFDLYSAIVLDSTTGTYWSGDTIAALLNIPILAGILLALFSCYKYPFRTRNQTRNKVVSVPLEQPGKNNPREKLAARYKDSQANHAGSKNSLNTHTTTLSVNSSARDVDDKFLNPPEDDDCKNGDEFYPAVEHSERISQNNSQYLEPIIEAQVLSKFGRNDQAIDLLLDALSSSDGNYDAIATHALKIIDDELDKASITSNREFHLQSIRNESVIRFLKEPWKLSDETRQKIQPESSTQINSEAGDSGEPLAIRRNSSNIDDVKHRTAG
jgi:hypothetical protein